MRILVLTLMLSFLSQGAFGADEVRPLFWQGIKSKAWSLHQFLTTPIVNLANYLEVSEDGDVIDQKLVSTFAGTPGTEGYQNGLVNQAQFSEPRALLKINDGRILVADSFNHCIRCIDGDRVTTFAGIAGAEGYQNGPKDQALFSYPRALLKLNDGRVLVADAYNNCIRCIDGDQVTTFAGTPGAEGYQNGPKDQAQFHCPEALLELNDGRILVTDNGNHCIRCIDGDQVTTIAGTPGVRGYQDGQKDQAQFSGPHALLQLNDGSGRILVADYGNRCIRCIDGDRVTAFAGTPGAGGHQDGQRDQARFSFLGSLLQLRDGRVLVADAYNNCIRCIDGDQVTTFAGIAGVHGYQDGPGNQALFACPVALLQFNDGSILVVDIGNRCIRCIDKYTIREKTTALKIHRYWRMCSSNPDYKLARKLVLERASISDDEKEESDGGEKEAKE